VSVIVASAATHVGKVREHNEDRHFIDTAHQMFMVADGMGGHAAGEIASRSAIEVVREAWSSVSLRNRIRAYAAHGDERARRALLDAVRGGVEAAHRSILSQSRADEQKRGMGTTFTGFVVAGGDGVFAHAGDSRAYLVRDGNTMRISNDHTVVARLEAAGVNPDDGEHPPEWTGMLTNALGVMEAEAGRVKTFLVRLYTGDRFLLCTDGVYEYLGDVEIGRVLRERASPALAANHLVETAVERGGHDNATAVVVKVVEAGETVVPVQQRERDAHAVARCTLLAGLSDAERSRVLRITTTRELAPGKELAGIALGNRVAYVVMEGIVSGPGGESYGPGAVVYAEALVEGEAWSPEHACQASTPVRLLTIRRDDFFDLVEADVVLGARLDAAVNRLISC
jgi:serine/threonine protein phosphatase PrpC